MLQEVAFGAPERILTGGVWRAHVLLQGVFEMLALDDGPEVFIGFFMLTFSKTLISYVILVSLHRLQPALLTLPIHFWWLVIFPFLIRLCQKIWSWHLVHHFFKSEIFIFFGKFLHLLYILFYIFPWWHFYVVRILRITRINLFRIKIILQFFLWHILSIFEHPFY